MRLKRQLLWGGSNFYLNWENTVLHHAFEISTYSLYDSIIRWWGRKRWTGLWENASRTFLTQWWCSNIFNIDQITDIKRIQVWERCLLKNRKTGSTGLGIGKYPLNTWFEKRRHLFRKTLSKTSLIGLHWSCPMSNYPKC